MLAVASRGASVTGPSTRPARTPHMTEWLVVCDGVCEHRRVRRDIAQGPVRRVCGVGRTVRAGPRYEPPPADVAASHTGAGPRLRRLTRRGSGQDVRLGNTAQPEPAHVLGRDACERSVERDVVRHRRGRFELVGERVGVEEHESAGRPGERGVAASLSAWGRADQAPSPVPRECWTDPSPATRF